MANVVDNLFYAARLIAKLSMSITLVAASAQSSAVSYVEARRSVLWLIDLDVHAFQWSAIPYPGSQTTA